MFIYRRGIVFVGNVRAFREALRQMMRYTQPNMTLAEYCKERV